MRKKVALLLMMVLVMTIIYCPAVSAAEREPVASNVCAADGFEVTFVVDYSWGDYYKAEIAITNTSDAVIENWNLCFPFNGEIEDIWDAEISEQKNGKYLVKNAGWNQDIAVGETVSFSFVANGDYSQFPSNYVMNIAKQLVKTEDYTITYNFVKQWSDGCIGTISIANISEETIEDWSLELYSSNLNNLAFEDADVLTSNDGYYEIHNKAHNQNIKPGETLTIGFTADTNGETPVINQFILSQLKGLGIISVAKVYILNALDGQPIPGAVIKLRKGEDVKTGDYVLDTDGNPLKKISAEDGSFTLSLEPGKYTAEVNKQGFIQGFFNIIIVDQDILLQPMVLTPILDEGTYRIVLTWDELPYDLDAHLVCDKGDEQLCHVYYKNKSYVDENGEERVVLDVDDKVSYGPETVTLTMDEELLSECTVKYMVHDYSDKNSNYCKKFAASNATVYVYKGNSLVQRFNIPQDQKGTLWNVFEIRNLEIVPINTFEYQSNSAEIQ